MADVDVKVGIQVTGDASGAKAVDEAIKQVGESAKTVAQETGNAAQQAAEAASSSASSAAESIGGLKESLKAPEGSGIKGELDGLKKALDTLSPEKAKGAVSGLTNAILGLASGDTQKGLSGLAQSLFNIAQSIPLPGAAVSLSFALTGLVTAFKLIKSAADESAPALNEFGQTVDAEMENIEAWANKQIEWDGLKESFGSIKGEFEKATKLTETLRDAMLKTFNQTYKFQIEGLKEQIESAKASGDAQRQAILEQNLKQTEQIQSIVNNTVALDQHKEKLQSLIESAELERQMIQRKEEIAKADVQRMESLRAAVEKFSGNTDATFSSQTSEKLREELIATLTESIAKFRETQVQKETSWARDNPRAPWLDKEFDAQAEAARKSADELTVLRQGLLDFSEIAKRAAEGQKYINETIVQDNQALTQAVADVASQQAEISNAKDVLANSVRGVESGIVAVATELAGEYKKTNDALVTGISEGAANLKPVGEIAAQAGKLIGVGTDGLQTSVEGMGADVSGSSEAASEAILEGNDLIKKAVEGTATEAVAAGDEIKRGADEFRAKIGEASTNWTSAAMDLVSSSRAVGRMVADMSASHLSLAQEVASLRSQTNSALSAANLALSQIRNSGR